MPGPKDKNKVKILSENLFPVVGVGASAGGLEAFKKLIKAIPEDSGMAYILVQHLEPTHESILTELLQKVTSIRMQEITNNAKVEMNNIYIIPSNKLLVATDGILQLSPRPSKGKNSMPIDLFFGSLAEVHQSHAIGIVLSGTATDGTLGLKAIKDHGGITFAQDLQSAAYRGMPQNAIDAGVVDFILAPEDMPLQLKKLSLINQTGPATEQADLQQEKETGFRQLLSLLKGKKGVDFTYYRQTTIRRRILRRMSLNQIDDISRYLNYVRDDKSEQDILFQDLLIPVTGFFRDSKIFEYLSKNLFRLLLNERGFNNPVRIWTAGCSTGEETYSVAISLHEYLGNRLSEVKIQIFATDISEKSIAKARQGIYSIKDVEGITKERLQRFFTKVNGSFQINKSIRDICVFASHNILKDPPFSKVDLICCRNVFIYMEAVLQKKALTTFHYALNNTGYLLLGKSETIAPAIGLFDVVDSSHKLYSRKSVPEKLSRINLPRNEIVLKNKASGPGNDIQKEVDVILLSEFTPPGVVVDEQLDIIQFRGSTGIWLEPPAGVPSSNVLKMARDGLAFEIRSLFQKAKESAGHVKKESISYQFMGTRRLVTIEIIPVENIIEPHFLILFRDLSSKTDSNSQLSDDFIVAENDNKNYTGSEMNILRNELLQVRLDMKNVTEVQEAVNEELQSANEELLSGSEELQSLNEELETSKEEIQSTNEELTVLNQELIQRNELLNLAKIYSESIIATVREPLVILNKDIRVQTANKSYYLKFKTKEEEIEGKLFFELGNGQWNIPAIQNIILSVLMDDQPIIGFEIKQNFRELGERIFLVNIGKIFRKENTEQLILLALEDVTEAKKREEDLKTFTHELEIKVIERTTELKESNLALLDSNENLKQFATIASHDLQEPLRKIRTFAGLLNLHHSSEISTEAKLLLSKINLSAERMSTLIKDVLHFSQVLHSKNNFEKVNLNDVLLKILEDFDLLISQNKAHISYDSLPVIDAIPLQMTQLFSNLFSNALKFSRPNVHSEINISSRKLQEVELENYPALIKGAKYYEIIFKDNGIGFDDQFSHQIFLIFQRLNAQVEFAGTGIGLALCKRIVLNHHGEIFAYGKLDEGASFHLILPLQQ